MDTFDVIVIGAGAMGSSSLPDTAQGDFGPITCLYTTTPDENFVIDRHPSAPNIIIGSPCSGHGFKFSIGVGRALADLAMNGATEMHVAHYKI